MVKMKNIIFCGLLLMICLIVQDSVQANPMPQFQFTEIKGIESYEYVDDEESYIFEIFQDEVLYSRGTDKSYSQFIYDHSLKLDNLSASNPRVIKSFPAYTECWQAKRYKEGYLVSFSTQNENVKKLCDISLVYLSPEGERVIDSFQSNFRTNNHLKFKIAGEQIIYTKTTVDLPTQIILYDAVRNTKESIPFEGEKLLDTDIQLVNNKLSYFAEFEGQAAFFLYDIKTKTKTKLPFDRKYRRYDYELTSHGIIASIVKEASPNYNYAEDKKAILFLSLDGSQKLLDVYSRFTLKSNGNICIGVDDDRKLFTFSFQDAQMYRMETGDIGDIYKWPIIIHIDSNDFYILAKWGLKNYDTETKMVKMSPKPRGISGLMRDR